MTRDELLASTDTEYTDWFGTGCLKQDLISAEKQEGEKATQVLRDGFMLLIFFSKAYYCKGYDSNEYRPLFRFEI
jgi:hypothetical protein